MAYLRSKVSLMMIIIMVFLGSYVAAAQMETGAVAIEANTTASAHPDDVECIDIRIQQVMDHISSENSAVWKLSVSNSCPYSGSRFHCGPANIILHSPDWVSYSFPPMLGKISKLYGEDFLINEGRTLLRQQTVFGYYVNRYPAEPFNFAIVSYNVGCEGV